MSRRIVRLGVIVAAVFAVLLPSAVAHANYHVVTLQGANWCSGDVPSPGAWVNAGWGRIRVCVGVVDKSIEGDIDDTRTDGYCTEVKYNEYATTDSSFHSLIPGTYVGSTRSCGAIAHFYANVTDVYNAIWKIRLYRSTAFMLALDTHTARITHTLVH